MLTKLQDTEKNKIQQKKKDTRIFIICIATKNHIEIVSNLLIILG